MSTYLYNGIELPILPDWDKETYPYAYIKSSYFSRVLYFSENPLKIEEHSVDADTGVITYRQYYGKITSHIHYQISNNEWIYNSSSTSDSTSGQVFEKGGNHDILWSNHDILNEDGSLYLAASEPIPVSGSIPEQTFLAMLIAQFGVLPHVMGRGAWRENWETLFEGEVETRIRFDSHQYALHSYDYDNDESLAEATLWTGMQTGDTMRLTIDGISQTYQLKFTAGHTITVYKVGNIGLRDNLQGNYVENDDGFGLYVEQHILNSDSSLHEFIFYTRTAETHSIKIEKKVT